MAISPKLAWFYRQRVGKEASRLFYRYSANVHIYDIFCLYLYQLLL